MFYVAGEQIRMPTAKEYPKCSVTMFPTMLMHTDQIERDFQRDVMTKNGTSSSATSTRLVSAHFCFGLLRKFSANVKTVVQERLYKESEREDIEDSKGRGIPSREQDRFAIGLGATFGSTSVAEAEACWACGSCSGHGESLRV